MKSLLQRFHRDEHGNVMVLYIGLALVTVCILFVIIGSSQRYLQKETVQDAADTTAFAGAVVRAKAFNLIAFCNVMMSVVMAFMVVFRGIQGGLILAILVAIVKEDCGSLGPLGSAIGTYEAGAESMGYEMDALAIVERDIALHAPEQAVKVAEKAGAHEVYKSREPTIVAHVWFPEEGLPVEDGKLGDLCTSKMVGDSFLIGGVAILQLPPGVKQYTAVIAAGAVLAGGIAGLIMCKVSHPPRLGLDPFSAAAGYSTPLHLMKDWRQNGGRVLGTSMITAAHVARRRAPIIAAGTSTAGTPTPEDLQGTAQAEVFGLHSPNHEDLMHMDWRARMSLSSPLSFSADSFMPRALQWYWVH